MSDRFRPLSPDQIASWVCTELEANGSILGVPRELMFEPSPSDRFTTSLHGHALDTPIGVAAGPHTQLAPNIVVAWLCGARVIELKTVQTNDRLEVPKPCIDMQDAGYNVEWSQELTLDQSVDQYLLAWVLIHALHSLLGFSGDRPGVVFNLSVGYDLDGIRRPNMQRFLDTMTSPRQHLDRLVERLQDRLPELTDLHVPARFADNITLSTMHGCPPDEIATIARLLMERWGLHTSIKLNPTLLGSETIRHVLHDVLGYRDIVIPDDAFEHDLRFDAALSLIDELQGAAAACGVRFGVKLANTLEVLNHRHVFNPDQPRMYLSGRPLHALVVHLAHRLVDAVDDDLSVSFAGGADAFNVSRLLAAGLRPVTTCSDLLRPGGYLRLGQYLENIAHAMASVGAADLDEFSVITAMQRDATANTFHRASRSNLAWYAEAVLNDRDLVRDRYDRSVTKTARALGPFDCIEAPCADECAVRQRVPEYMRLVHSERFDEAAAVIRSDNPLAAILGRACHHPCERPCLRTHMDDPLAIREIKRFVMDHETAAPIPTSPRRTTTRVAVIGGGPCGLSAATFLARAGVRVTVFEARSATGGMVSGTIPGYRAAPAAIEQDLARIEALGIEVRTGVRVGDVVTLDSLHQEGFDFVVVAAGAQRGQRLGIPGEDHSRVRDGLEFLRAVRNRTVDPLTGAVLVIGGGDAAIDCARSARRLGASEVAVLYRRTIDQMPAQREELQGLDEEGIEVRELVMPLEVTVGTERPLALRCGRTRLGEVDASGRRRPVEIPGSDFDLSADLVIVAIGQQPDLSLFGDKSVAVNESGYLEVDSSTLETSIPNVFAGGDIVGAGPASIVKAAGDGRVIASAILARLTVDGGTPNRTTTPEVERTDFLRRRAHRVFRDPIPQRPASDRDGFSEVVQTLTAEQAILEAQRCLDCDVMCSTCEWVCPNRAIFTFSTPSLPDRIPLLIARGSAVGVDSTEPFPITQKTQVAVLADLCNECGNCVTFCPTSGSPHRDKPRLYLDREEFEAQDDNAFMVERTADGWTVRGRISRTPHQVTVDGRLRYTNDVLDVELDPEHLDVMHATVARKVPATIISLRAFAALWVVLRGVSESVPWLPTARPTDANR